MNKIRLFIVRKYNVVTCDTLCWRCICCGLVSVCPSVCLSQAGVLSKRQKGSSWFLTHRRPSACRTVCCVEIRLALIPLLSSGTLCQTLNLADFSGSFFATARRSSQVSSICSLERLESITLNVHLCLQHHVRNAERRAV